MRTNNVVPHAACGFMIYEVEGPRAHRGIISDVFDAEIEIRAVDHGWKRRIPISDLQNIRFLDKRFADTPFVGFLR